MTCTSGRSHISIVCPAGSPAIDAFLGDPRMIGQGHGSAFLRLLAERLTAEGAPLVVIDPDVENLRARRACEKAGFRGEDLVEDQSRTCGAYDFRRMSLSISLA